MSRSIVRFIILAALACSSASAQISSATLVGTVTDATGAAVAGAIVEARNPRTQNSRTVTTDSNGDWTTQVPPGDINNIPVPGVAGSAGGASVVRLQPGAYSLFRRLRAGRLS